MSINTPSRNWGAYAVAGANAALGLGARGTIYIFNNFDTSDKFIFLLADLGFGFAIGPRLNQGVRNLGRAALSSKSFYDPNSYTKITANREFSAGDLNWSPGAEMTIGVAVLLAGLSATAISAWPFFDGPPRPGVEVNNDYFSGQVIYNTNDVGLSAGVAYQFIGRWVKLWSF